MAMNVGGGGSYSADINMTPMIDVLLVLLVIFMMQVSLQRKKMDVQLPPVQKVTSETPQQSNQIVMELKEDGTMAINSNEVSWNSLDADIHSIFDTRPKKLMFIKTARNRKFVDVIRAMDIARGAGVQVIGFTPPDT